MVRKNYFKNYIISITSLLRVLIVVSLLTGTTVVYSQNESLKYFRVEGVVYEMAGDKRMPLSFVTVGINEYGLGQLTNENGQFELEKVPAGNVRLTVKYMGKLDIDTLISVDRNLRLNFLMKDENFNLKEVTVTAENTKAGQSTASLISKNAMDHLQANSIEDIFSLLPGGVVGKRHMNSVGQLSIRDAYRETVGADAKEDSDLNSLGVSIITDGAPLSNNANLQNMRSSITGTSGSQGGTSSPGGGVDVRSISMDNIESVEVIRGVPSVEYGDVTSGVVIVNTKAGREPLNFNAKANQHVYEFSLGHGISMGEKKGALHLSANYAHSVTKPEASYMYYERVNAKTAYSNVLFDGKLSNNTSFNVQYGKDRMKINPDKEKYKQAREGRDIGFRLNTNGILNLNKGILNTIRYVASTSYVMKDSYAQGITSNASASYSQTTTDGAILSNRPGIHLVDENGEELTNFGEEDRYHNARYLPSSYLGYQEIEGREFNVFAKLTANLFQRIGATNNKILIGADFKLDKNYGDGTSFRADSVPAKQNTNPNASFRPRSFREIPALKQLGVFVEENFSYSFGNHMLELQAGLRYDHISVVKGVFSPRFNGSMDVIPNILSVRGGYGVTAKAPTLFYLYPEKTYFEFININELTKPQVTEDDVLMTTTKVYDTQNKDLKIAKNHRAEIGFDLNVKKAKLAVTAYRDRLKNGYGMNYTAESFNPFIYKTYTREGNYLVLASEQQMLNKYYRPTNNKTIRTEGVEFDLSFRRFDAIRTAFSVNGAWIKTKSYNTDYYFYDPKNIGTSHVAVYEQGLYKKNYSRFSTTFRVTHNIPEIGFVVTLTGQTIWNESDWYNIGKEDMPIKYISKEDGRIYDFSEDLLAKDEFKELVMNTDSKKGVKESYSPIFCFNINITKELGDWSRLSFFSNNMFRSFPIAEKKRNPGTYYKRNDGLFTFGVELALTIK